MNRRLLGVCTVMCTVMCTVIWAWRSDKRAGQKGFVNGVYGVNGESTSIGRMRAHTGTHTRSRAQGAILPFTAFTPFTASGPSDQRQPGGGHPASRREHVARMARDEGDDWLDGLLEPSEPQPARRATSWLEWWADGSLAPPLPAVRPEEARRG